MMSFRKVRNFGLGLIIAILVLVGLIPTFVTRQIRDHNATFLSKMQALEIATNLQNIFWRASTEFHDLVHRSEENFDSIINGLAEAIRISQILEKKLTQQESDEEVSALKKLQRHTKIFKIAVIQYRNEFNIDPSADNTAQLEMIAIHAQKQTNEAFSHFIADVTNDVKMNQIAIDQTMKSSQIFSIIGLLMGILAGIFVAIYIGRALNKPIQRLVKGTERVAQGELSYQIDETDSDEIGQLASAFNKMSENLLIYIDKQKKLARIAEEAAESEKNKSEELVIANSQLEHEIAVRKIIEEELIIAKEKAEHSSQAKSEFLANMSHELRTPLNHIIGFTELVLDKNVGELNELQKEYLTDVHGSSNHLLSLINDILDLSKVEAGKLELIPSDVDPRILLENSLIMIKEKAMRHGINISLNINGIPAKITADERKLKQIMYNLLSNAVKFTPDGGQISITAQNYNPDSAQTQIDDSNQIRGVKISVSDTGIGLKPENLDRIFKPFEQVENTSNRRFQGTGLGLSLTKNLVELHGGEIWVDSKGEGSGSKFMFTLPTHQLSLSLPR